MGLKGLNGLRGLRGVWGFEVLSGIERVERVEGIEGIEGIEWDSGVWGFGDLWNLRGLKGNDWRGGWRVVNFAHASNF